MSDHDEELVQIYSLHCDCSPEDQADEDLHPEDGMGQGTYCLRTPIGTACIYCSEYADRWIDHIDEVDDEDDLDVTVLAPGVWVI